MNAVVLGHAFARGRTSGSVAQKRIAAATRATAATTKTRRNRELGLRGRDGAAELADALVGLVLGQDQVRAEADRVGSRRQTHEAVLEAGGERAVARLLVGQVKGDEEPPAADVAHDAGELAGELAQPVLEML